jgi:hypothetical protein
LNNQEIYKLPIIEIENRTALIEFLSQHIPYCVFESVEEVNNPVGRQWNYTLTSKIILDNFGAAILEYKEFFWDKYEDAGGIIALWLKEAIPTIDRWYRGKIKP